MKVDQSQLYVPNDPLATLINCGGYYKRPRPNDPIVGYAGTYKVGIAGEPEKAHFVGVEYFNCAKLEQYPRVLASLAYFQKDHWLTEYPTVVLGAPMGGILFSYALATAFGCRVAFAEKKTVKCAEGAGERDTTELILKRHQILPGDYVVIGEDACNNYSTTVELVKLIVQSGGIPCAIACIVNRSGRNIYSGEGVSLPVHTNLYMPTEQYRQDDPVVAKAVADGNVIWEPKPHETWAKLTAIMANASAG